MNRKLIAEALGSFFLFATVIGSGVMAENLAAGNVAIALLGNTLATAAMLLVLITVLGPISGAHFNPAVSLVFWLRAELSARQTLGYVAFQLTGGVIGVWAAHIMFDLSVLDLSTKTRTGTGQWISEMIATFGLIFTILGTLHHKRDWIAPCVAAYIAAAYWFTSSTSFANPAITIARSLSNTFAGIAPGDVPGFVVAQLAGAMLGLAAAKTLFSAEKG